MHANGMYFTNLIRYGKQAWHGAERLTLEIQVETGNNYPDTLIRQLVANFNNMFVKELCLIYAYNIIVLRHQQYTGTGIYWGTGNAVTFVTYDILITISGI